MEQLVERLLFLQQFGNALILEVRQQLARLYAVLELDLRRADPTGVQRRYQRGREMRFMGDTRDRVRSWLPAWERHVKARLAELGRHQGMSVRRQLMATLGDPAGGRITPITEQRMRAILNTEPFQGRVLKDHGKRLGANLVDRVGVQVRLGMAREETIDDLVRRIRGRRVAGSRAFTGGVLNTTTREAEALVRTAVTHTSNAGILATLRASKGLLSGVRYTATLDDRTTELCMALDGTEWDLDDPDIVVPGRDTHYNCRSVLVGIIDHEKLGLPKPPEPRRAARDLSTVTDEELDMTVRARRRAGAFGDVERLPSSVTAQEWLRRQRRSVQDKILGRSNAERFRAGASLRELVLGDRRVIQLDAFRN